MEQLAVKPLPHFYFLEKTFNFAFDRNIARWHMIAACISYRDILLSVLSFCQLLEIAKSQSKVTKLGDAHAVVYQYMTFRSVSLIAI